MMMRPAAYLLISLLALSGKAFAQDAQVRAKAMQYLLQSSLEEYKKHFNADGEWLGTAPVFPLIKSGIAYKDATYRELALQGNENGKNCAQYCAQDLKCGAFSYVLVPLSPESGKCLLKRTGDEVYSDPSSISGLFPSRL